MMASDSKDPKMEPADDRPPPYSPGPAGHIQSPTQQAGPYPTQPGSQYPTQPAGGYQPHPGAQQYPGQPGNVHPVQPGGAYTGQPWMQPGGQPYPGQPVQTVNQVVVVNQLPMVNKWAHDLFSCFDDIEATCLAYWVPCVQFGLNAEALGHDCCLYGTMFACAAGSGFHCIPGTILREEIRQKRGIEGDSCNDCLIWYFCGCCALVQEAQELKEMQREPVVQVINRA